MSVDNAIKALRHTETTKLGEWIYKSEFTPSSTDGAEKCDCAGWVCSHCDKFPVEDNLWDDPTNPPPMAYCPNCGAKMHVNKNIGLYFFRDGKYYPITSIKPVGNGWVELKDNESVNLAWRLNLDQGQQSDDKL